MYGGISLVFMGITFLVKILGANSQIDTNSYGYAYQSLLYWTGFGISTLMGVFLFGLSLCFL